MTTEGQEVTLGGQEGLSSELLGVKFLDHVYFTRYYDLFKFTRLRREKGII